MNKVSRAGTVEQFAATNPVLLQCCTSIKFRAAVQFADALYLKEKAMNKQLTVLISALLFVGLLPALTSVKAEEASVVEKIVGVQHDLFDGPRQGLRSNHTKGIVVTGEFTPAATAAEISQAAHLQDKTSPVVVRFSNATGFPDIADNNPKALVKGMAIRIDLGDEEYTDMVLSSVPLFPVATPEKFLEMLTAVRDSASTDVSPKPIETFLEQHPAAKAFVSYPKPYPQSFATLAYHGVNAFKFTNAAGESVYGRYIVKPVAGVQTLDKAAGEAQDANYLMTELPARLANNAVEFSLAVQIADKTDEVNDATVVWPENRPVVELGTLRLTAMHENAAAFEKATMFNPLALPEGIAPSDDPILLARPGAYAVSFQHRLD